MISRLLANNLGFVHIERFPLTLYVVRPSSVSLLVKFNFLGSRLESSFDQWVASDR